MAFANPPSWKHSPGRHANHHWDQGYGSLRQTSNLSATLPSLRMFRMSSGVRQTSNLSLAPSFKRQRSDLSDSGFLGRTLSGFRQTSALSRVHAALPTMFIERAPTAALHHTAVTALTSAD